MFQDKKNSFKETAKKGFNLLELNSPSYYYYILFNE